MKCHDCQKDGIIGQTLLGRANGTIAGTRVKRVDYLCAECAKKIPIDKQQGKDNAAPF